MTANQGAASSSAPQEYTVRVPEEDKKKHHVMKFNEPRIDFRKWNQARLGRENNLKEFKPGEEMPKFGAGSEFGRENREEARKKKYGMHAKKHKLDDQPWCLRLDGKTGKKYKGIREGGVAENASYYVFTQAPDGAFETYPLNEWYHFTSVRTYRTLNAEEAEEEFIKRDKVFNYFSIMMKKRLKNEDDVDPDGEDKSKKGAKNKHKAGDFKISEMDEWVNSSDDDDDDDEDNEGEGKEKKQAADKAKGKKKAAPKKAVKKKKKKGAESDDSEGEEDSDDGDDEGREVDYISDESSESEREEERAGKGVEDEEAIRKMDTESESEEESAEKKEGAAATTEDGAVKKEDGTGKDVASTNSKDKEKSAAKEKKDKKNGSSSSSSSDTSDSDDFDNDTSFQTPIFMQDKLGGSSKKQSKKSKKEHAANAANRSDTPTKPLEKVGGKRNLVDNDTRDAGGSKRIKLEPQTSSASASASSSSSLSAGSSISIDGISEDSIRRYLMRKPLTASELLQKFKSKKTGLSSEQMVNTIAQILKRLNPDKQMVKGKMYLSIRP